MVYIFHVKLLVFQPMEKVIKLLRGKYNIIFPFCSPSADTQSIVIQQLFLEPLLYARHYFRCLGYTHIKILVSLDLTF